MKKSDLLQSSDPTLKDLKISNRRVLIVEDEKALTDVYREILTRGHHHQPAVAVSSRVNRLAQSGSIASASPNDLLDFELTVCSSGPEALEAVKQANGEGRPFAMGFFDVLLGDKMDGIEVVRQVFELDHEIFAVFVTAYQDRTVDSISEIVGRGNLDRWDYLNKPFSEGEILQKARQAVVLWNLKRDRQQKNEQLMDASKKLLMQERESSAATVSRSVAHEFGNVLLQISGTAELNINSDPEKMKKALTTILAASDTAAEILEKFKGRAKSNSDREGQEFSLLEVIEEARGLMDAQFKKSHVQFCLIKREKIMMSGNRTGLLQVFLNILINATHAMPHGGQIDISMESRGGQAEIVIRDYGPGVPAEVLPRIFDPFFSTKGEKGSGLGLAICREIVEIAHGGEIEARNHHLKGAELVVRLPLKAGEEAA